MSGYIRYIILNRCRQKSFMLIRDLLNYSSGLIVTHPTLVHFSACRTGTFYPSEPGFSSWQFWYSKSPRSIVALPGVMKSQRLICRMFSILLARCQRRSPIRPAQKALPAQQHLSLPQMQSLKRLSLPRQRLRHLYYKHS